MTRQDAKQIGLESAKKSIPVKEIFRFDSGGLHPKRIRMEELKPGDLFMWAEDNPRYVSPMLRCVGGPRPVEVGGFTTCGVICEGVL